MMLILKKTLLGGVALSVLMTANLALAETTASPTPSSPTPTATTSTFRVYNGTGQDIAVRVDAKPVLQLDSVLSKTASPYYSVTPGTYNVEVNSTANSVEFKAGQSYTLMQTADGKLQKAAGDAALPSDAKQ